MDHSIKLQDHNAEDVGVDEVDEVEAGVNDAESGAPASSVSTKQATEQKEEEEEEEDEEQDQGQVQVQDEEDGDEDNCLTENGCSAYSSTNNPSIDLFFQMGRGFHRSLLPRLVESAWKYNPLHTVKTLLHARDVRNGKGEKAATYDFMRFLRLNKPKTYAANLSEYIKQGCVVDLLKLAATASPNFVAMEKKKEKYERMKKSGYSNKLTKKKPKNKKIVNKKTQKSYMLFSTAKKPAYLKAENNAEADVGIYGPSGELIELEMFADLLKEDIKKMDEYEKALTQWILKYPKHAPRLLSSPPSPIKKSKKSKASETKSETTVEGSTSEEKKEKKEKEEIKTVLTEEELELKETEDARPKLSLSLAAKWAPTARHAYDRQYKLTTRLALLLFGDKGEAKAYLDSKKVEYEDLRASVALLVCEAETHSAPTPEVAARGDEKSINRSGKGLVSVVEKKKETEKKEREKDKDKDGALKRKIHILNLYRKQISKARKYLDVTECYMTSRQWNKINYAAVPGKCMERNNAVFQKYDTERYTNYIQSDENIKTTGVEPHDIVSECLSGKPTDYHEKVWSSIIDVLKKKGNLGRALSMCDVSGSMQGTPLNVCIALGLITAELVPASSPFYNKILTFSTSPSLCEIKGNTLREKVKGLSQVEWGMSTNICAAFDTILQTAKVEQLETKYMPTTLFIYSDMQFDQACDYTSTAFERMQNKYQEAGYTLPNIVFWNLRSSRLCNFPVKSDTKGVALVSGFSQHLLNLFMESEPNSLVDDAKTAEVKPTLSPVETFLKAVDGYTGFVDPTEYPTEEPTQGPDIEPSSVNPVVGLPLAA